MMLVLLADNLILKLILPTFRLDAPILLRVRGGLEHPIETSARQVQDRVLYQGSLSFQYHNFSKINSVVHLISIFVLLVKQFLKEKNVL